ncbi:MAG: DUF455 family protein [Bdellovibrionia bacterium]
MEFSFNRQSIYDKLSHIEEEVNWSLKNSITAEVPIIPAREIQVLEPIRHPPKKGLSFPEGRARLLHDLASIELQAMELGLRTLVEFPLAPQGFREELAAITLSEAQHLKMCLEALDAEGFKWGDFPVHTALWGATSKDDSLLDRILIVHRYLEGSGLDAGDYFVKRLDAVDSPLMKAAVKQINDEEVGHVYFGSQWYRRICELEGVSAQDDFVPRMIQISTKVPKRVENINHEVRKRAGFTESEIYFMEKLREWFLIPLEQRKGMTLEGFIRS